MASRLEVKLVHGKSRAVGLISEAPLKLIPTSGVGDECRVLTSSYGGGVLQTDFIELEVLCHSDASLYLGAQGNNHIYISEDTSAVPRQEMSGQVCDGGFAIIAPEPTVLHQGARFQQCQKWDVHSKGSLLLLDWIHVGRSESGESFEYHYFGSEVELSVDGSPCLIEHMVSEPGHEDAELSSRFGHYRILLTIYAYGEKGFERIRNCCDLIANDEIRKIVDLGEVAEGQAPRTFFSHYRDEESGIVVIRAMGVTREDLQPLFEAVV